MARVWTHVLVLVFAHFVVSQTRHQCSDPIKYPDRPLDDKYVETSEFNDGDKVAYKCSPGYAQTGGSRTSFCQRGQWTPLSLQCGRKKCSSLKDIQNGKYNQNGQLFGDTATAECNDGYVLTGDKIRVCGENGWNGSDPLCLTTCPRRKVVNGRVNDPKPSYKPGDRVTLTCNKGFSGSGVFTCAGGRKWLPHLPKCEMVKCPRITISRGSVSTGKVKYDTTVAIRCDYGFRLHGASRIRCEANGSWTPAVPKCESVSVSMISCSAPSVANGGITYGERTQYKPHDTVTISCREGFDLIGSPDITCGPNGQWQALPECRPTVKCSAPAVANGDITYGGRTQYKPHDRVTISCREGFDLIGSPHITCGPNGQWQTLPKCQPEVKCSAPAVANGGITYGGRTQYKPHDGVTISCREGFDLIGSPHIICGPNGQWQTLPKCQPEVKCSAPAVANRDITYGERTQYKPHDTVTISCREGFDLIGSPHITCGPDGQWQALPECHPEVKCSAPAVANGLIKYGETTKYKPQDTVTISCKEGFDLIGSPHITCLPDGHWEALPECRIKGSSDTSKCGPVPSHPVAHPKEEYLQQREHTSGDRVQYRCGIGFRRSAGRDFIYCKDGRWTELQLQCEPKNCGSVGEILNGHFEYTGVSFGDSATVVCDEGYELIGPAMRHCRDGGWDGRNAECEPVYCPPPPEVKNADMFDLTHDPVPFGHAVSYRCRTGTLIGAREIHCTKNGRWSAPPPECRDVVCPFPRVPHGSRIGGYRSVYRFGNTMPVTCYPGYRLKGDNNITCGLDGKWKPELSNVCVRVHH